MPPLKKIPRRFRCWCNKIRFSLCRATSCCRRVHHIQGQASKQATVGSYTAVVFPPYRGARHDVEASLTCEGEGEHRSISQPAVFFIIPPRHPLASTLAGETFLPVRIHIVVLVLFAVLFLDITPSNQLLSTELGRLKSIFVGCFCGENGEVSPLLTLVCAFPSAEWIFEEEPKSVGGEAKGASIETGEGKYPDIVLSPPVFSSHEDVHHQCRGGDGSLPGEVELLNDAEAPQVSGHAAHDARGQRC